jgi:hypothetical protein
LSQKKALSPEIVPGPVQKAAWPALPEPVIPPNPAAERQELLMAKHPPESVMPFAKDEVAEEFEVIAPPPDLNSNPPPLRESPDELKVEVAVPMMFRRSASKRLAISRFPARVEVPEDVISRSPWMVALLDTLKAEVEAKLVTARKVVVASVEVERIRERLVMVEDAALTRIP